MKQSLLLLSFCFGLATQAQNNFKYLDINNIKAGIGNRGMMHYNPTINHASYEAPAGSGIHSDLNTNLWIGAYDAANTLHMAAQLFHPDYDFWPGPLDTTNAAVTPATSSQYDKIWKLNQTDIDAFITNFNNGHVQNGSYTPVADLLSWPAQGTGAQSRNLAPFVDINHNHIYDPLVGGDYPIIKGDQSLYYIFNDNLAHASGGTPLKVEVHATAYAYGNSATASQNPFLGYATFYNYKIINRSNQNYSNAFITLFSDVDLGYYGDDYIGCDVQGNYGYAYNADAFDETIGNISGYGNFIPAAGYQVLKGIVSTDDGIDNDNDNGLVIPGELTGIDEPCERMGMTRFNYFNNSFPGTPVQQMYPSTAQEYYRYMSGSWRDGTPFTCGGNGYGGGAATPFVYPGTTYTNAACGTADWSEITAGNTPNNRRYMIGTGPFSIGAGGTYEMEYVHCTSFPTGVSTATAVLNTDMQLLRNFYTVHNPNTCMPVSLKEQKRPGEFRLYPNPATSEINLSFTNKADAIIEVSDVYGKLLLSAASEGRETVQLNINTLASGIYFVKVSSEGHSVVRKFIRQ